MVENHCCRSSKNVNCNPPERPSQGQPGFDLTASAPVSDVSAPARTNGVWPPLRPVSVAQKNKPSTMLSSNVQSIDLPIDCMAWRFWTMRQSNGCSTPAPRFSATKQWLELAQKMNQKVPVRHSVSQHSPNTNISRISKPLSPVKLILTSPRVIFTRNKIEQRLLEVLST